MTYYLRLLVFLLLLPLASAYAQFPPQAGLAGTTAMHRDSTAFVAWASYCNIQRGWMDIADTTLGKVTSGDSSQALGYADGNLVSLGDAGEAIFFFENPIIDGPGPDFAIFENGFPDPADSNMAYLELATVSVSNDGFIYFPFMSTCNVDTTTQIPGFGVYTDARKIHNLAGKYINGFGTPFDLQEFAALSLDVNNIRYVKVSDAVGSIAEAFCTRDQYFHKINDPYPTPFATGGFDLDALGIIHQKFPNATADLVAKDQALFYPNPTSGLMYCAGYVEFDHLEIFSLQGQLLLQQSGHHEQIDLQALPAGNYLLIVTSSQGARSYQRISKYE